MKIRSCVWSAVVTAATLCLFAVACTDGDGPDRGPAGAETVIVHPVEERLLSSSPDVQVIDIRSTPGSGSAAGLEPLQHFDDAGAVGVAEGDPDLTLGTIEGATFLSDGRLALVDRDFGLVRLLGGSTPDRLGGFGEGPGEFSRPTGVAEDNSGGLLVLDRAGGALRIERFAPEGSGFAFDRRRAVPLFPGDGGSSICITGGRTYVSGVQLEEEDSAVGAPLEGLLGSRSMVHELDDDGGFLRSFGAPYGPPEGLVGAQAQADNGVDASAMELDLMLYFGTAQMACDGGQGGQIWVAFSELGELHLHTTDGELVWIARLSDFKLSALHQTITEFGTSVGGDPNRGFPVVRDRISDVALVADEVVALQVTRTRTHLNRTREFSYRTYLLDANSGQLLGAFTADHRIVGGEGGRVLLYREAPHPQVFVTTAVEGM
ncbi:MAG: hypothetical protein EA352_11035 [Gemmatimonadales bacterium]|nr:MAG: hypothetical protein EA352_11035 [Gemmatimonadales bacterium]